MFYFVFSVASIYIYITDIIILFSDNIQHTQGKVVAMFSGGSIGVVAQSLFPYVSLVPEVTLWRVIFKKNALCSLSLSLFSYIFICTIRIIFETIIDKNK